MALEQGGISTNVPGLAKRPGGPGSLAQAHEEVEHLRREIQVAHEIVARRTNEMLLSGLLADRPAAGTRDRIFFATDQASGSRFYFDTGTAWVGQ